jgi:hypothetical protein
MQYEFSPDELGIIQNGYISKSARQLASLIGCPVDAVEAEITRLQPGVKSKQQKINDKISNRPKRVRKLPKKERVRIEKLKQRQLTDNKNRTAVENEWQQQRNSNLTRQPRFKNIAMDYSAMVLVKIDKKTSFYVKKGEDIAAAKEKFLQVYAKSFKTE